MAASEAEAMPLPREDTTPPVTKIRGVIAEFRLRQTGAIVYLRAAGCAHGKFGYDAGPSVVFHKYL